METNELLALIPKAKTPNEINYKIVKQTKTNISFTETIVIPIKKDILGQVDIDDNKRVFTTFANLMVYVLDENGEMFKMKMHLDYILDMKFSQKVSDSNYTYFILEPNQNLFVSNFYEQKVDTAYAIFASLINGKYNDIQGLSYSDLPKSVIKMMESNEIGGNMSLPIELMISSLCRNKAKPSEEFRYVAKMNVVDADKFIMINIREIPRNTSSFSAISSENINEGLVTTIGNTKSGLNKELSPLEAIALNKF